MNLKPASKKSVKCHNTDLLKGIYKILNYMIGRLITISVTFCQCWGKLVLLEPTQLRCDCPLYKHTSINDTL